MRHTTVGLLAVIALVAMGTPVLAGGWATVRLDEPPGEVLVEVPWTIGFTVMQHDITPNSDVTPVLRAMHRETAEEITATGRQEGPVGHFLIDVTFPRSGEWKWAIQPEPYAETSFETLTVLASPGNLVHAANVFSGTCAAPGEVKYLLGEVAPRATVAKSSQLPIAVGNATIAAPLSDLLASEHAIGIGGDSETSLFACGDLTSPEGAEQTAGEVVLGLQGEDASRNVGVAMLRDEGERTAITLYLLNPLSPDPDGPPKVADSSPRIEILDTGFAPYSLQIARGETVTWINASRMAHTVTGEDLVFDDSGLIDPGDSFPVTFAKPGTYHYRCAPHPGMVGVIVVT